MAAPPTPEFARLRVDHVGSLHRPEPLKELIARHARGEVTDAELHAAQDDAIREAVAAQEAVHFPLVTDGELRRITFMDSFAWSVSGFRSDEGRAMVDRLPAAERLRLVRNQPLEEYRFTHGIAHTPVKMTLVSPDRISDRFAWERSHDVYPDMDAFLADVVAIQRQLVAELVAAGCRYIQIDAPSYTAYVDPPSREQMRARGEDPDANLERSMAADNALIADFPGVTFGIHLCRGNTAADQPPPRQGHYDGIAERLFNTLNHHRLLLEYDTERAGSFAPLRFVPKDKTVVLGLVSTKLRELESADAVQRRIDEAAQYVPVDQIALSPQCGFASRLGFGPNRLSHDEQWRKLEQILKVADDVWG
jgi:5-methyltetrahydropteroyltriglutamate--homocysteine methyltransferase